MFLSKPLLTFLAFFSFFITPYNSNKGDIQCPHGCGDPDQDERIVDIKQIVYENLISILMLDKKEVKERRVKETFSFDINSYDVDIGPYSYEFCGVSGLWCDEEDGECGEDYLFHPSKEFYEETAKRCGLIQLWDDKSRLWKTHFDIIRDQTEIKPMDIRLL
jgi:hypothetical protein